MKHSEHVFQGFRVTLPKDWSKGLFQNTGASLLNTRPSE